MDAIYPAKLHIRSLASHFLAAVRSTENGQSKQTRHIVYLHGQHTLTRDDTDRELPFHQEANCHYLTGCLIPGSTLVLVLNGGESETESAKGPQARLFIPPYDADAAMWSVPPPSIEAIASSDTTTPGEDRSNGTQSNILDFELSELGHVGKPLEEYLTSLITGSDKGVGASPKTGTQVETTIHVLSTNPLDPLFPTIPTQIQSILHPSFSSTIKPTHTITDAHLRTALHRARLIKSPAEMEYIREANRITSVAHEVVMRELGRFARKRGGSRSGDENGHLEDKVMKKDGVDAEAAREDSSAGSLKAGVGVHGPTQWEIKSEQDAEALFVATCKRFGADQAYLPIVASGSRASTLHYVCNDRVFPMTSNHQPGSSSSFASQSQQGRGCCGTLPDLPSELLLTSGPDSDTGAFTPQVLLIDAGCEVRGGYASDVTRTIPVGNGGKFTKEGRWVYELVLRMQKAAEKMLRPGVHWDDLHFECHRILCEAFLEVGIFRGATVDEILKKGLTAAFYPHGLGHSLGLDVHDSLQLLRTEYIDVPQRSLDHPALFRYLRIRRPILENMVLTIEPGCYFPPALMESFGIRQSEFVDTDVLDEYVGVGGVRIEDVVVVTKSGCENLTTVGREADWIEAVCSGH